MKLLKLKNSVKFMITAIIVLSVCISCQKDDVEQSVTSQEPEITEENSSKITRIDQRNGSGRNRGGINVSSEHWQEFQPGVGGLLTAVDLGLNLSDSVPNSCSGVQIRYEVEIQLIPGVRLASQLISLNAPMSPQFTQVNFTNPPLLTSGLTYRIVFRRIGPRNCQPAQWQTTGDQYARGSSSIPSRDFHFNTYMDTVL